MANKGESVGALIGIEVKKRYSQECGGRMREVTPTSRPS